MPIFRNRDDKALPLLTKAYQVDPDDIDELIEFLQREGTISEPGGYTEGEIAQRFREVMAPYTGEDPTTPRTWEWQVNADLEAARRILEDRYKAVVAVRLAQNVMRTVYLRNTATRSALATLSELLPQKSFPLDAYIGDPTLSYPEKLEEEVPLAEVEWIQLVGTPAERIADDLARLVRDASVNKAKLGECVECGSIFVSLKQKQRFCSHRCAHRQGHRRRMRALRD